MHVINENNNETKRCNKCHITRFVTEFFIIRDKLSKECKFCNRIKQQEYRNKNTGRYNPNLKRECKICKKTKSLNRFYRSSSGYYRFYCIECYEERINEEIHKKDLDTREQRRINERNYYRKDIKRGLWRSAKCRAKKHCVSFNIEKNDIIIPEKCPVLGIEIKSAIGQSNNNSPSIDRIIPQKGYIKENIRVISWLANSIKNDSTLNQLEKVVQYIKDNLPIVDYSI